MSKKNDYSKSIKFFTEKLNPKPKEPVKNTWGFLGLGSKSSSDSAMGSLGKRDYESGKKGQKDQKGGLLSGLKTKFNSTGESVSDKYEEYMNRGRNLKIFGILFVIGGLFLFMSTFFLPVIIIRPAKFTLLFTFGSLLILVSFAFMGNPKNYLKRLCHKDKRLFTTLYVCSILLSLYASIIAKSYFLALISCILEFFALLWFVCSSFPGGRTGAMMITKLCLGAASRCFVGCFNMLRGK